jgi:hypothetical protein
LLSWPNVTRGFSFIRKNGPDQYDRDSLLR